MKQAEVEIGDKDGIYLTKVTCQQNCASRCGDEKKQRKKEIGGEQGYFPGKGGSETKLTCRPFWS